MSTYSYLIIDLQTFTEHIEKLMSAGNSLLTKKVESEEELEAFIKEKDKWENDVIEALKTFFALENNKFVHDFNSVFERPRFHLTQIGHKRPIDLKLNDLRATIESKIRYLAHNLRIIAVCDYISQGSKFDFSKPDKYTTQKKLELLLEKLYILKNNFYYPIGMLLEGNGIKLKNSNEPRELASILQNNGYVELLGGPGLEIIAKITTAGCLYFEENVKPKLDEIEQLESMDNTGAKEATDYSSFNIPIIALNDHERLWMRAVYKRMKSGQRFTFKEIWVMLHEKLPVTFRPGKMDARLTSSNGEELRLLGIIALEKNFAILDRINAVIRAVRDIILTDPEKRNILIEEIAASCSLPIDEISLVLHLIREYGQFFNGCGFESDKTIFKSIDVGGNDSTYYEYIQFPGIEHLIQLKSHQSFTQPGEKFTYEEMMDMSQKLDEVLKELQTLKTGQEVIWTDVLNELNELKAHFNLNKKNWKQLFWGKMFEMVASGVISETFSKRIAEAVNPVVSNLLE